MTGNAIVRLDGITSSRDYVCHYTNQGGRTDEQRFHINVVYAEPTNNIGSNVIAGTDKVVNAGTDVTLALRLPDFIDPQTVEWSDGTRGDSLHINAIDTSHQLTATLTTIGQSITFVVCVKEAKDPVLSQGNYRIRHILTDTYLTHRAADQTAAPALAPFDKADETAQVWILSSLGATAYNLQSAADSLYLTRTGDMQVRKLARPFRVKKAAGIDRVSIASYASDYHYWGVTDGQLNYDAGDALTAFDFQLIPVGTADAINVTTMESTARTDYFSADGRRLSQPAQGVTIVRTVRPDGIVETRKVFSR